MAAINVSVNGSQIIVHYEGNPQSSSKWTYLRLNNKTVHPKTESQCKAFDDFVEIRGVYAGIFSSAQSSFPMFIHGSSPGDAWLGVVNFGVGPQENTIEIIATFQYFANAQTNTEDEKILFSAPNLTGSFYFSSTDTCDQD